MAQCKICKQLDGKHLSNCPYYTGDLDDDTETPIEPEKTYCSHCGELIPNHKITCPLYDSGGGVITDDKSICENCNKSALEVEEPSTTSELLRVVGDKMCTNMELYEFADSSNTSKRCPAKRTWNNKNIGRWNISIDDSIKDNQLFALKNVVKELKPIDLNIYFDIKSSRDANNLIFDLEIVNTNNNIYLLTKYTEKGRIEIYGYYIDKTVNRWRKFTCGYTYSNKTSNQFSFKETGITISKKKGDLIQPPAPGEYHNINSWIDRIYLDGRIVYNSNYPISFTDSSNIINLTFNISGNTNSSRPLGPDYNSIYIEIHSNSNGISYLNKYKVGFASGWTDKNITTDSFKLKNYGQVLRYDTPSPWPETVAYFDFEYIMKITNGNITINKVKEDVISANVDEPFYEEYGDIWDGRITANGYTIQGTRYSKIDLNYKILDPNSFEGIKFIWDHDRYIDKLKEIQY